LRASHQGITFFSLEVLKLASDCGAPHFTVYGSLKKGLFFEGSKEVASKISTKDNIKK